MQLSKISIKNTLGIEALELSPGKITRVTGANGTGKTSVVEAIRAVFAKGSYASLKRVGQEKGEVVLEIQDGDKTHTVRRAFTGKGDRTTVDGETGGKGWLQEIAGAARLNPAAFLTAKPAERVKQLLRASQLDFPKDELNSILAPLVSGGEGHEWLVRGIKSAYRDHADPFEAIEAIRKVVYDHRTQINGARKEAENTAAVLSAAVPEKSIEALEGDSQECSERLNAKLAERDGKLKELERQILSVQKEYGAEIAELRDAQTVAEEKRRAAEKSQGAIEAKQVAERRAAELGKDANRATNALEGIDVLKGELASAIGIPGVAIVEGDIVVNGVSFDRLNTQQKIDVAVTIAEKTPSALALCLVDGLEVFDAEHQAAFIERAERSGLQYIITSVSDGALEVA